MRKQILKIYPVKLNFYFTGVISLIAIFFMLSNFASAVGAPDYLPDGPHPRIWLTSETLSDLDELQESDHALWVDLETWCDAHLNDAGYDQSNPKWSGNNSFVGYRMSGYDQYLQNFSLAYQLLKDDNPTKANQYAAFVRNILIDGIAVSLRAGEENNGLRAIRNGEDSSDRTINQAEASVRGIAYGAYKLGYSDRNVAAVAVSYDWIYDTLSQEDKDILVKMMMGWFDWTRGVRSVYNNGVLYQGIRYYEEQGGDCSGSNNCTSNTGASTKAYAYENVSNNFMGGHILMMTTVASAIYGDDAYAASTIFPYVRDTLVPTLAKAPLSDDLMHSGGDSPEGWSYGGGFWYNLKGLYAYFVSTGDDIFSGFSWPLDLLKANIHRLYPNRIEIPVWGDNGVATGNSLRSYTSVFFGINAKLNPDSTETKVARWLLDNVDYPDATTDSNEFLWTYKDIVAEDPATANLPLFYHAKGNGLVSMRSSWQNSSDTVLGLIRLEGKHSAAHENYDEGGFYIIRGSDALIDRETYTDDVRATSTIVFNDQGPHGNNPLLTSPAIDKIENTFSHTFVSGDITNMFKRQFWANKAELVRRSFLYVRPNYFVVHDLTRGSATYGNDKDWYTQYPVDPTIIGNTISVANGSSKAFVKTLYPTGGTYTKTNYVAYSANRWSVKYEPAITQEYDQFLHVIEASGSTDSQTPATLIEGIGGRGTLIENPGENIVAMFTSDPSGADITNLSYSATTSTNSKHIITSLTPNQNYNVRINAGQIVSYLANSAGIIEFLNASPGSHDYLVTVVSSDIVAPSAPSGLSVM